MAIRYALYPDTFRKDKPDGAFVARVHHSNTCDQKMLVELIVSRNRTLPPALVESVLEEYATVVEYALSEGMRISTPLVKIQASIQGKFAEYDERRYPEQQPIVLKALPGKRLKKLTGKLKAERVDPKHPCPAPTHLEDIFSDTKDQRITARGVLRLRGRRLKFDPEDPRQGIFLIPEEGENIRIATAITNIPSQLLFQAPNNLPSGTYQLQVRAIVGNSTVLRQGMLPYSLTATQS
uniref:DUF4469 domain-containing protein n=1 Tax=Roseihalotalea indica TaxID=2867963 RepID=A0AA49GQY0_9BACT|nr:DUF4469 domain-containing protein [Tunicatimonas sp. TK19036]